ncbi:hypothetical protein F7Q99_27730 [Streptomyces kaniharaensis]|uniref:Uncharacterized protein n=1 Tax=Streptomyces kaniharaensis TaxID=212423 RepID=A0A6N7L2D8_9ACTN|nr:DUF6296 family protein [Streptomyces kaniharaensis]MQS15943.1 hypothetical protein [Streptomyces kaniharaensis]
MDTPRRYAITLPRPPGAHPPPEIVIVYAAGETTTDGTPVYTDEVDVLGGLGVALAFEVPELVVSAQFVDPVPPRHLPPVHHRRPAAEP